MNTTPIRVLLINATLKGDGESSSTQALGDQVLDAFAEQGCETATVRPVELSLLPGISPDLGEGDDWPALRRRILDSDIVVFGTPTWLGAMTSVMRRVLERLNADISTRTPHGRPLFAGTVAAALVVGNEDGAHRIVADLFQAANDLAFTVPANACTYWNGRAREKTDFIDLSTTPESVRAANRSLVANALHLARALKDEPYPVTR